jgi:hypothetical protein
VLSPLFLFVHFLELFPSHEYHPLLSEPWTYSVSITYNVVLTTLLDSSACYLDDGNQTSTYMKIECASHSVLSYVIDEHCHGVAG